MNQRIIYPTADGVAVIIPADSVEAALKDVPAGVPYEIVDAAEIPTDRTFRGAWVMGDCCVEHDLERCKEIAHDYRRAARSNEFEPHDEIIAKQIPGADAAAAEVARQEIRDRYADIQTAIEAAATVEQLLEVTP
jgi:hypothetical protein